MSPYDPQRARAALATGAWSGLVRLDLDRAAVGRWDATLLRRPRVLVPVDVQALYVPEGDETRYVRLPLVLTAADGAPPEPQPAPFADGEPRPPGVHLHWAPPDALLRGRLEEERGGNRLALPPLPDRWVVLRLLAPRRSARPHVRGWVLEADRARAVPLEAWPAGRDAVPPAGRTVEPAELTGSAGGALAWTGMYDAGRNRLAFHDPLDDLATAAPAGAEEELATYLVCGWWSDPALDPLDAAQTSASLAARLLALRWRLDGEPGAVAPLFTGDLLHAARRLDIGLPTAMRYPVARAPDEPAANRPAAGPPNAAARTAVGTAEVAPAGVVTSPLLLSAVRDATAFTPAFTAFADLASSVVTTEPRWPRSTLLHGVVHGVPVAGPVVADRRPSPDGIDVALGASGDDVAAALAAEGIGEEDPARRRALERALTAFTGQLLPALATPDGAVDVEEHEHAAAFEALPGGEGAVERLRPAGEAGPPAAGRLARAERARAVLAARLEFTRRRGKDGASGDLGEKGTEKLRGFLHEEERKRTPDRTGPEFRAVRRPAPRFHRPIEPVIAVRNGGLHLRHGHDGRFSPDGLLQCRWPSQISPGYQGVVRGADLLPTLGSGALPPEVLPLARHALLQNPYLTRWLAAAAAATRGIKAEQIVTRLEAEAALRFGADGRYDGTVPLATDARRPAGERGYADARLADQLRRFSLDDGVDPAPEGVTAWAQPWIPLWLEWEVEHRSRDRLDGWRLGAVDLERPGEGTDGAPEDAASRAVRTVAGRTPVHEGTARTLAGAIAKWRQIEEERDDRGEGEADEATEAALAEVAAGLSELDLLTTSLDGLRDRLLGLPPGDFGALRARAGDALARPAPVDLPRLLAAGELRLLRARLVDAFGRTLHVPVERVRIPERERTTDADGAPAMRLRPRLQRPARWRFRLVDPADPGPESREATIDQVQPELMVNPVSGFLLPDHIDEALECFDATGTPLGQLMHEPFGGGVVWEIAPGRDGPPDAGPLHGLAPAQGPLGFLAAGVVTADAAARAGQPAGALAESALSAMLRAIDTTLWTVDTFATLGNQHIAGLVGRPIAVVRATLRLDVQPDLDELDLAAPGAREARAAAYAALADRAFPVRLGELTRSDDGLLGFFVDDDYLHFHVVDRVVRDAALVAGRGQGQLARLGTNPALPAVQPIAHPYVVAEDELLVRPGQVVRLTLLLHPAGKVHLTSGILPRKALQLAREWVQPGLSVMAPSARVGPVLIEPGEVRLPKISVFPAEQVWTRRTSPTTWRDDPILAATQAALLPDTPAEVQEGYIRIQPMEPPAEAAP